VSGGADARMRRTRTEWAKPVSLGEKVANVEAGIIGLAISSLYQKLDKMGFSSGQEFMTAIREADASGAALVLGDRPVDMTLKRLQQSIEKTGFNEVMAFANSQAESSDEKILTSKLEAKETSLVDAQGTSYSLSLARLSFFLLAFCRFLFHSLPRSLAHDQIAITQPNNDDNSVSIAPD